MTSEIVDCYLVQHKQSESEAQITCGLDENNEVRVSSVKMLSGKVVPLRVVRAALVHFKENQNEHSEPDQLA